jgi:hypothetical protein
MNLSRLDTKSEELQDETKMANESDGLVIGSVEIVKEEELVVVTCEKLYLKSLKEEK